MMETARWMAAVAAVVLTAACGGTGDGAGDEGDEPTGETETGLGASCANSCEGTFCSSGGTFIDEICPDSDLELPCVGTATGMFCSRTCSSDADCDNPRNPMRCLTACGSPFEDARGKCWVQSDYDFMVGSVCQ